VIRLWGGRRVGGVMIAVAKVVRVFFTVVMANCHTDNKPTETNNYSYQQVRQWGLTYLYLL